ncbi:MAG: hypothetical protein A2Y48_09680 [Nitrospirae bacterium RIFCSPLOW2_12_42_9]|nr:MAG: hypothetical protein A2Z60_00655 [Nitrospirae bacterium RIFCSPLOWO2_02_42_7]OGW58880.1 MAG: hypothetical protein A2Y48_09680 [Nitrospirae bacterium RIFCSPLOW2_12_42_9]HAS18213.1 hypothetical protein [Nitrospiraceae bacterium]HBI22993.1 hypothetical protein [Nitrospiraceae bacterium]
MSELQITIYTGIDNLIINRLIFIAAIFFVFCFTGCATVDTSQYQDGPYIVSTYPSSGDFNISRYTDINVKFSDIMDPATEAGFEALSKGMRIDGSKRWLDTNTVLAFRPYKPLEPNTTYQCIIREGKTKEGKDLVLIPYIWMFTTGN